LRHISHETRSAILAAKYVSTIPGIAVEVFGDGIISIGDGALMIVCVIVDDDDGDGDNVSFVSNLIFLIVLLFIDPLDDLIKLESFVRNC
jgi:hypothetical protein